MVGFPIPRRLPVRFFLLFVAVVLVLPGLVFGGILLDQFAERERAGTRAELLATTARIADAVDRELGVLIIAARVLATSERAVGGDLIAFSSETRDAAGVLGQRVLLLSPNGARLVTTADNDDADPPAAAMTDIRRVVETRQPVVSGLLGGADRPRILVLAPVLRENQVIYVVGLSLGPKFFIDLLRRQSLPDGWLAALRDADGTLIARSRDAEGFVGSPLPPAQRERLSVGAVADSTTLEGASVLAASSLVALAGWHANVGVLRDVIEAPIRHSEFWLAITGAAAMTIGFVLAWQLASRISGPLASLAQAGQELGAGRDVAPVQSGISEVQDVSAALVGAHDQLRERTASLAAERARLAAIIETVPVGLLIADASGRAVAGNRQLGRMLRGEPLDLAAALTGAESRANLGAVDARDQPVPEQLMPLSRALAGEDPAELHSRFRRADGSLFWAQAVAAPFTGAAGEVTGAVLALLDTDEAVRARRQKEIWAEQLEAEVKARTSELEATNRQLLDEVSARGRAEDQLRQSQKMDAVGRLTGGIAHDFNNLLTVILGSLELLRRRVTEPRALRLVDSAADGANRATKLIGRLLAFSRRQPLSPQRLDVNQLVLGMSTLLRRSLGETIAIQTVLLDELWEAMADPNQLESALLNLAVNARDAIVETSPGCGNLRIETSKLTVGRDAAAQTNGLQPGDYVVVATIDDGCGMSPKTVGQAFEPFFTTKPHGKGTGLGLSQVHGFAAQSGGHVTIESELGRGTTVKLFLPRARSDAVAGTDMEPHAAPPAARPGIVILVVDDEPAVRLFTAEALRLLGYAVLEASGGEQALGVISQHSEIELMITDVVMPGMNGRELAREVERSCPDLPILLVSGYSRSTGEPDDTRWQLLAKPFTLTALAEMINEVLVKHGTKDGNGVANGDAATLDNLRMNA